MKRKEIGFITVDAGIVYVGDPCYQSEKSDFKDWDKFGDKLMNDRNSDGVVILNHDKGPGKGIVVNTAFGDGIYPVYMKYDKDGDPTELIIKLQ